MKTGVDMWMLGAEAGAAEAELMVTEKVRAAIKLQTRLLTGALGDTTIEYETFGTSGPASILSDGTRSESFSGYIAACRNHADKPR